MNKTEKLLAMLNERIDSFMEGSKAHKKLHRRFTYSTIVLTLVAAVLGGVALYKPAISAEINLAIVIVSALTAALTAVDGLRKPSQLWVHERTISYALIDLEREIKFNADASTAADIEKYFERMQHILASSGDAWQNNIAKLSQSIVRTMPFACKMFHMR